MEGRAELTSADLWVSRRSATMGITGLSAVSREMEVGGLRTLSHFTRLFDKDKYCDRLHDINSGRLAVVS